MWPICLVLGLGLISSECFAAQLIEPNDLDEDHLRVARKLYDSCLNTDNGVQDNNDYDYEDYGKNGTCLDYYDINDCGRYDNENFKAKEMCCVCGGGKRMRYQDSCVLMRIDDSECDVADKTILECNSEGVQHNDLCYSIGIVVDANIDGSIIYDVYNDNEYNQFDYTTAQCGREFLPTYRCIKECESNSDCTPRFPYCIEGSCEECMDDNDCPMSRPYCTKTPKGSVARCIGPYPLSARAGECSDMGLQQLTDESICNQTVLNYFELAVDPTWTNFTTINDTYHLPGCNVRGGLWPYFNYAPTGNPHYNSHAVCVAEPIDCEYSEWTTWTSQKGKQVRTRDVKIRALFGGLPCDGETEQIKKDPETCDDGILNQDEEKMDCGGVCPACPGPTVCKNKLPKRRCRAILMNGKCGTSWSKVKCCATCRAGCANIWKTKKCMKLIPHCRRSSLVRRKCQKACRKCK